MFSGAQVSLYLMTDDFVPVIMGAINALDPYKDRLQIETDDISALLIGTPDVVLQPTLDLFISAAALGKHCVLHATISQVAPVNQTIQSQVTGLQKV